MLDDACFDKDQKNKLDQFFIDIKDEQWDAIFLNASEPMKDLNRQIYTFKKRCNDIIKII